MITLTQWTQLQGTGYGFKSPLLLVNVIITNPDEKVWLHINKALAQNKAVLFSQLENPLNYTVNAVLNATKKLQRLAGLPSFEKGKLLNQSISGDNRYTAQLAIPYYHYQATLLCLKWLSQTSNFDIKSDPYSAKIATKITELTTQLRHYAPSSDNTLRFLKAAHQLNIPWLRITDTTFQVGHGKHSQWLDSSFSESSSAIAVNNARNKVNTSAILRQAGLPTIKHHLLDTFNDALEWANKLNYPLTIKPADKHSGVGVTTHIQNQQQLQMAYQFSRSLSRQVILQKHVEGISHRLFVFNGKLIGSIARLPGGVTGDGENTIAALLDAINANPLRSNSSNSPMSLIKFNDEAKQLLEQRGLNELSVPEKDQFIPLRTSVNINNGASILKIKKIHPDNQRLVERAAKTLKLDIAGIDLITADIGKSWQHEPAVICDVETKPQLSSMLKKRIYQTILVSRIKLHGRIPVVLIVSDNQEDGLATRITAYWQQKQLSTALCSNDGLVLNNNKIGRHKNWFSASLSAIKQQDVGAIIIACSIREINRLGLPVDKLDQLIIADKEASSRYHLSGYQLIMSQRPQIIIAPDTNKTCIDVAKQLKVEPQLQTVRDDLYSVVCEKFKFQNHQDTF